MPAYTPPKTIYTSPSTPFSYPPPIVSENSNLFAEGPISVGTMDEDSYYSEGPAAGPTVMPSNYYYDGYQKVRNSVAPAAIVGIIIGK